MLSSALCFINKCRLKKLAMGGGSELACLLKDKDRS